MRVLEEIAALVERQDVDVLVVAGDVFDHQNPSSAMYKMLYGFFDRLASKIPDLQSVIIAGNHDSAGRLEAPGPLLKRANVTAVGSLHLCDGEVDLDHHLVPVTKKGKTVGHVLAVPYLRPADLPGGFAATGGGASSLAQSVRGLYRAAISGSRKRIGDRPLVVTGHLHVKGGTLSESTAERRIVIGGEHAISADIFGSGADYVALGHLHRAQGFGAGRVKKGRKPDKTRKTARTASKTAVRYAGSPLPLSVVERGYDHGVSLIEIGSSRCITVSHVPLPRPVPFLRVPETGHLKIEEVEAALEALGLDEDAPLHERPFVEIAVQIEGPQPGVRGQLDEICARFPLRDVAPDILWPGREVRRKKPETVKKLGEYRPVDLFRQAFVDQYGVEPDEEHLACFHQLCDEVGS